MFRFLRRLFDTGPDFLATYGYQLDFAGREYISELGALGTHAWVVTDFPDAMPNAVPGAMVTRLVNMGDLPAEPLRRTRTVKGPMVLQSDHGIPLFQGEKAPPPAQAQDVANATDYLDAFSEAMAGTGYPS